jgi:hypothetical protein
MRVFPLLDLQAAEFVNEKARPGAGLHVQSGPRRTFRRTLLQQELHDDLHKRVLVIALRRLMCRRVLPHGDSGQQARCRRAPLSEGMDDPETV